MNYCVEFKRFIYMSASAFPWRQNNAMGKGAHDHKSNLFGAIKILSLNKRRSNLSTIKTHINNNAGLAGGYDWRRIFLIKDKDI